MTKMTKQDYREIRDLLKEMQSILDSSQELDDHLIVPLFQEVNKKLKGVEKGISLNLLALSAAELFSSLFPFLSEQVQRSFIEVALMYWTEKSNALLEKLEPSKDGTDKADRRSEPAHNLAQ